jgi:hypothetical protein
VRPMPYFARWEGRPLRAAEVSDSGYRSDSVRSNSCSPGSRPPKEGAGHFRRAGPADLPRPRLQAPSTRRRLKTRTRLWFSWHSSAVGSLGPLDATAQAGNYVAVKNWPDRRLTDGPGEQPQQEDRQSAD